jgi:hypothetical protein
MDGTYTYVSELKDFCDRREFSDGIELGLETAESITTPIPLTF